MHFEPLGDQAILAYCETEAAAFAFAQQCQEGAVPGLVDIVQAYTSVAVYYDVVRVDPDQVIEAMRALVTAGMVAKSAAGRLHIIPCCYELGPDLERVATHSGKPIDTVIGLHVETEYTVFAIGFCPGFPYLGYLPDGLAGVPRLPSPRLRVEPGSVGMTGRQTGIYTEPRPGGWNLIGRTPLELVNVAGGYFPLRTGDRVRFRRIGVAEYHRRVGERLA
jgi:inhibitor of KinA